MLVKFFSSLALCAVLLAGCGGDEHVPFVAPIDFAGQPPTPVTVRTIEIVDEYVPPKSLPNVEHAAPTPPYKAVRLWTNERLKAVGESGYLRVGIRDAHIVERAAGDQVTYLGRIDVALDADGGNPTGTGAQTTGSGEVTVTRQVTVDKDLDLAAKERVWDDMTRQMMVEFSADMQRTLHGDLAGFVAR